VFWDAKVILLIDYLEKGRTITGEYYSNLLDQLDVTIFEKRPDLKKKKKKKESFTWTT
jgi:Transposase.